MSRDSNPKRCSISLANFLPSCHFFRDAHTGEIFAPGRARPGFAELRRIEFNREITLNIIHEKTEQRLRKIARRARGGLGWTALDLTSGERFSLNEDAIYPQASAIKIAILMEVFKQQAAGNLRLSESRTIANLSKTGGSGILNELGDGSVTLSLHDLCVLMILVSDNTATNLLLDLVGMEPINQTLEALGLKQTRMRRRMMDLAAAARGEENTSTPAEAARLMELLFRGEFVNRQTCDDILAILKKTKPSNVKAGLPAEIAVAGKPGGIAGVVTEWAIVYAPERPYVVALMDNFGMGDDAPTAMREISCVLYEHFSRLARATPFGAYVDKPKKR